MEKEYYNLLTEVGTAKLTNATLMGGVLKLTTIKVGDGGADEGKETFPQESAASLVREKWSGNITNLSVDPENKNWVVAEAVIPVNAGGFYITEFGLYDDQGDLICIGKYPRTYKPKVQQNSGSASSLHLKVVLEVSNAKNIELKIDPAIVLASREYVKENYVPLVGGTMAGPLVLAGNKQGGDSALNLQNSNIFGVHGIYSNDAAHTKGEGLVFPRENNLMPSKYMDWSKWMSLRCYQDHVLYWDGAADRKIYHEGYKPTKEDIGLGDLPNEKSDAIDEDNSNKLATAKAVKTVLNTVRSERPYLLLSKNQAMELAGSNKIKGFNTINSTMTVVKEATLHGRPEHDIDHTGNGYAAEFRNSIYDIYVNHTFHIVRIKWKRGSREHPARIDDNWFSGFQQGAITTACYLKLLSGDIDPVSGMKPIIDFDNEWKLYGTQQKIKNIASSFYTAHSKLALSSQPGGTGEMLICLFGSVSGFFPYEDLAWGVFPEFAHV